LLYLIIIARDVRELKQIVTFSKVKVSNVRAKEMSCVAISFLIFSADALFNLCRVSSIVRRYWPGIIPKRPFPKRPCSMVYALFQGLRTAVLGHGRFWNGHLVRNLLAYKVLKLYMA